MVVEKLKEREDARDAKQDERALITENDKLKLSLKNAQDQYLVAVWELKEMKQDKDMLLAALKTIRKQIDTFIKEYSN